MEDDKIIRLFWDRNEQAIEESSLKYGAYCSTIANNILYDRQDAEECVNDTWLRAWGAMPPNKPRILRTFFGKITRNLAFDLYRKLHRDKRGGGNIDLILDELAECVSGNNDPEGKYLKRELISEINGFLDSLKENSRNMFILRYWYACTIPEIASRLGMNNNSVSVELSRIRMKLRSHLIERGYDI